MIPRSSVEDGGVEGKNMQTTAENLVSLGAGRMGRSIAVACALAGCNFTLVDLRDRTAEGFAQLAAAVRTELNDILDHLVGLDLFPAAGKDAVLDRIRLVGRADAPAAVAAATVLFEAVPETVEAKREALGEAGAWLAPEAIVASTSSTMLSGELAAFVPRPERFLNAHWLNPAYLVPLVEVAPHAGTLPEVREHVLAVLRAVGKVPVVCSGAAGYIVPRLQVVVMNEAARMIEQGAATAEDIDLAIRYGFGIRYASMGVAEFIDFGGVDIIYHASRYLADKLADDRYACPDIVSTKMAAGELGVKTGRGFYEWDAAKAASFQQEAMRRFAGLLKLHGLTPMPPEAAPTPKS